MRVRRREASAGVNSLGSSLAASEDEVFLEGAFVVVVVVVVVVGSGVVVLCSLVSLLSPCSLSFSLVLSFLAASLSADVGGGKLGSAPAPSGPANGS
jgi:hypothetical protein